MAGTEFDVVISGGGLSGLLTAIGLLNESPDISLAIIEPVVATPLNEVQANFDGRCIALSYGSLQLLNHWQIWPELKPLSWPIKTIVTSDRGHIGKTIMKADDYGLNAMGHVAEMRNMGQVFQQTLARLDNNKSDNKRVHWFNPDAITKLNQTQDAIHLALSSGRQLQAKLLVVAEGGWSGTRELLGLQTEKSDYPQSAVIANVKVKGAEKKLSLLLRRASEDQADIAHHVAFERFTTSGPIALLPIGEQEYSLVWTDTPERAAENVKLSPKDFLRRLQADFGFAAGEFVSMSEPAIYPLSLIKTRQLFNGRGLVLGNSAHTVHPIAGQGFNLGLRDIAVLVNEISQAHKQAQDIGAFQVLHAFESNRLQDIDRITGFTDLLVRGFALKGRIPAATRTLGLMTLQKCDGLQQWLALHFMSSGSLNNIPQLSH